MLPGRAAGGASRPSRGSIWGSRLSRSLRGMPWLGANGLLPGRGAPGRGPGRLASPPSRAAGVSNAPVLAAAVLATAVLGTAVLGTAVSGTSANGRDTGLGPGVGTPGREGASGALTAAAAGAWTEGATGAAGAVTAAAAAASGCFAADFLAVDAAPALAATAGPPAEASSAGNVSRILRTTGGSMVEDADRTNSPCSFKWLSKILLSTPSSLASS